MHSRDVWRQPHHQDPYRTGPPEHPPNNGNQWTVPPPPRPPRRSSTWLLASIGVLGAVVVVTFLLLLTHQRPEAARTGQADHAGAAVPTAGSDRHDPTSTTSGGEPAPPASAPTGAEYGREQPAVGDCVDTSRGSKGGVVLYRADCDAPSTPLVLDRVVPPDQRCEPHGYASIRGFDNRVMCFAWMVRPGDCLELEGPRKAPCAAGAPPDYGTVTITDVRVGATDGSGCADPNRWLQAGSGAQRGVGCFLPTSMANSLRPGTSR